MSLYTTKIGDYNLKVDAIRWSEPISLAKYEFPFLDGAAIDNMGAGARQFSMTTFWMGSWYSRGFEFLKWIRKEKGVITFVHPQEGVISGRFERANPLMDNRRDFVQIEIEFVEQLIGDELVPVFQAVAAEVEDSFVRIGVAQAESAVEESVAEAVGGDAVKVLKTPLRPGEVILANPLGKLASKTRNLLRGMDRGLNLLDSITASIEMPASSLIASLQYATTLPGKVVQSVTNAVASVAQLVRVAGASPTRIQAGIKSRLRQLENEIARTSGTASGIVIHALRVAVAQQIALETAYCYDSDNGIRDSYSAELNNKGFTATGDVVSPKPVPNLLAVPELEASLYEARKLLSEAYETSRGNLHGLKQMAHILEKHVSMVKLERDKLVSVDTGGQIIPLHVMLRERGLSPRYLELVMALNPTVENPTFVCGSLLIHANPEP